MFPLVDFNMIYRPKTVTVMGNFFKIFFKKSFSRPYLFQTFRPLSPLHPRSPLRPLIPVPPPLSTPSNVQQTTLADDIFRCALLVLQWATVQTLIKCRQMKHYIGSSLLNEVLLVSKANHWPHVLHAWRFVNF